MKKELKNIIFIPSNEINPVNQLAGTETLLRCEKALEEWRSEKYDLIIVSGGCTNGNKKQTIPSANIMKKWFISKGIEEDKILSENKSLDTYTNIYYSLKLLQDKNITFQKLTIISHWTHLIRIKIILWRNYRIKAVNISIKYNLSFLKWCHEIFWFVYNLLDKNGNGIIAETVRKIIVKKNS